jgi:glyoxylase-like metal-dependent hydrolase (beta-lactamase superfamily II)
VYLPKERILFTGDILVQSPVPYTMMAWPLPWTEVLAELERLPVTALVPGHGPVLRDHSYTRRVRELLEAVTARVREMVEQGRPVEWIQDSLRVDDIRRQVPAWSGSEHDADWDYIVRAAVERAWRGVRGQG